MKTVLYFTLASWLLVTANAEFSAWTRNDGKSAELDLISVADADGEKSGSFKTRSGQTVTLKTSYQGKTYFWPYRCYETP